MISIEELVKRITFINESYLFGEHILDIEKIKRRKVKVAKEHVETLLDTIQDMIDALRICTDEETYTLRAKMLGFLLEAYDILAKAVKYYHYAKRLEANDEFAGLSSEEVYPEFEEAQGQQED